MSTLTFSAICGPLDAKQGWVVSSINDNIRDLIDLAGANK